MLTEEEKRKIEEKIQYEEEYRKKLNENKPSPVYYEKETEPHPTDNNPYTKELSKVEITSNIIPGLRKIHKYLNTCEDLEEQFIMADNELEKMQYKSTHVDKHPVLTVVLGGIELLLTMFSSVTNIKSGIFILSVGFIWEWTNNIIESITKNTGAVIGLILYLIWLVVLLAIPFFVVALLIKVISIIYCKLIRSKILAKKIPQQEEIVNEMRTEYTDYVDKNIDLVKDIPERYRTTECIGKFIEYFESFRVKSFQEAFNELENEVKEAQKAEELKDMVREEMSMMQQNLRR